MGKNSANAYLDLSSTVYESMIERAHESKTIHDKKSVPNGSKDEISAKQAEVDSSRDELARVTFLDVRLL